MVTLEQVFEKLLKLDAAKVGCTICAGLKYVTADDERFAHLVAGTAFGLCAFFAGREASQHIYASILGPSKKAAKAINAAVDYGEKYFGKG